jgi:hypothetical protein
MALFNGPFGDQQLPPWLSMYFDPSTMGGGGAPTPGPMPQPAPMPAPQPMPTPDPSPLAAGKPVDPTAAAPAHTGFLARLGQRIHSPDFGMRVQAALAAMNGNPNAGLAYQEWRQQQAIRNEELQRQLRTEQRTEQDQANQIWGLKESGNFSNPEIAAMTPEQRGAAMAARIAPWTASAGQMHNSGGVNGVTTMVPTENEQTAAWLDRRDPTHSLGDAFAGHTAMPSIAFQPGGGVAGMVPQQGGGFAPGYIVQPAQMGVPAPSQPGTAGAPAGGARNNPGGLRYPGSTQFRSFPDQAAGIAAGQAQLGRYMGRGINTVRGIVETWAPRRSRGGDNSDESVNNYIAHVASRLGVSPDQPLPPSAIPQIFAAQTEFETGHRGPSPRLSAGNPGQAAALRAEAQRAIAAGADPAAVNGRLRQMGVN